MRKIVVGANGGLPELEFFYNIDQKRIGRIAIRPYSYQITTNHQLLLTIYFLLITIYVFASTST
jgi:hypothetical protein